MVSFSGKVVFDGSYNTEFKLSESDTIQNLHYGMFHPQLIPTQHTTRCFYDQELQFDPQEYALNNKNIGQMRQSILMKTNSVCCRHDHCVLCAFCISCCYHAPLLQERSKKRKLSSSSSSSSGQSDLNHKDSLNCVVQVPTCEIITTTNNILTRLDKLEVIQRENENRAMLGDISFTLDSLIQAKIGTRCTLTAIKPDNLTDKALSEYTNIIKFLNSQSPDWKDCYKFAKDYRFSIAHPQLSSKDTPTSKLLQETIPNTINIVSLDDIKKVSSIESLNEKSSSDSDFIERLRNGMQALVKACDKLRANGN